MLPKVLAQRKLLALTKVWALRKSVTKKNVGTNKSVGTTKSVGTEKSVGAVKIVATTDRFVRLLHPPCGYVLQEVQICRLLLRLHACVRACTRMYAWVLKCRIPQARVPRPPPPRPPPATREFAREVGGGGAGGERGGRGGGGQFERRADFSVFQKYLKRMNFYFQK